MSRTRNWSYDLRAAFSVALVALPLGLGIASTSGFEPIAGVTSIIIGAAVATFVRGGHVSINGPGAGLVAVLLIAVISLGGIEHALGAIVISGFVQILFGLFRWGNIATMIPNAVIQGFLAAIGVIIMSKELYFGFTGYKTEWINPMASIVFLYQSIPDINPFVTCIFVLGLGWMFVHSSYKKGLLRHLPPALCVLVITIPFAFFFDFFNTHTLNFLDYEYLISSQFLIQIPDNIADAFVFPSFEKINTFLFWQSVFAISLIGTITSLICAKAVDKLDPQERKTDLNKDIIGMGIASVASGMLGGLPIITVIVRSTVNIQNGAKTKWSNFYHAIFLLVFIMLARPFLQWVPRAALSAILVYTGITLASPKLFTSSLKSGKEQLGILLVTFLITLILNQIWGILAGMIVAFFIHYRLAGFSFKKWFSYIKNPQILVEKKNGRPLSLQLKGFINSIHLPKIEKICNELDHSNFLEIDLSQATFIDATVMDYLRDQETKSKNNKERNIHFANDIPMRGMYVARLNRSI